MVAAAAAAKSGQSCPTLCDPIDGSPTGSSVPGILQARILIYVKAHFHIASKKLKPRMTDSLEKKFHVNGEKRTEVQVTRLKVQC